MDCVDIANAPAVDMDVADDAVWSRLRAKLQAGRYTFLFAGPPCRTFSLARLVRPGPPPLRDRAHPYGFPRAQARDRGLRPADFEKIRMDNLLAIRTAEACAILHDLGYGYAVEQPAPWGRRASQAASMFDLQPFADLRGRGARVVVFDQCAYGAQTRKPTQLLYHGADFQQLEARCRHPVVRQQLASGKEVWAAHPPCVGVAPGTGQFATAALAAYPKKLNEDLANIIADYLLAGS